MLAPARGNDYEYDDNGNLIKDKNKNITTAITYNHLNLPTKIIFTTGNIVYIYTASGQKMQKIVTEGTNTTTTDYLGGYQYQNTVLQFFPTAECYIKNTPVSGTNTYSYVFNYTDHLGNVRLSYTKNTSTNALTILDENSYYPFGLKHTVSNAVVQGQDYKYKFNGKELQDELQLNLYDFGARNYDPALGLWMNIDPLVEKTMSSYGYCHNNPVNLIDPTGMAPTDWWKNNKTGKYVWYNQPSDGPLVVAGHSYIGASLNDVTNDFNNSNNFFIRNFSNPKYENYGDRWNGEIQSKPLTKLDNYAYSNNIVKKGIYDFVDQPFVGFQTLNPFDQRLQHLNGDGVSPNEKIEGGVSFLMLFAPSPKSEISLIKPLSKLGFSRLVKGTFISKLNPTTKTFLNENLNNVIKATTNEASLLNNSIMVTEKVTEKLKKD